MRIVLMGTGPFAVPAFEAIRQSEDEVVAVITKPIRQEKKAAVHPVAQWAQQHHLRMETPVDMREESAIDLLRSMQADLSVVCDYGQILKREALEASRLGAINLHGSLLPKHRGAAPIQWSILAGDTKTGVAVIRMTTGLDSGPILTKVETEIRPSENAVELEARLSALGVDITLAAINLIRPCSDLEQAKLLGEKQDPAQATKAPRLNKTDGQLDFRWSVTLLDRIVRAMQPWPNAYADLLLANSNTLRVQIHKAAPIQLSEKHFNLDFGTLKPGEVFTCHWLMRIRSALAASVMQQYSLRPNDLVVVAQDGFLKIETIQPSGKRPLRGEEFAAGYCKQNQLQFLEPQLTTLVL